MLLGGAASCAISDAGPVTHPSVSVSTAADPVAARADVTYIIMCETGEMERRPVGIVLDCTRDMGALDELTWQQWGEDKATATGVYRINSCDPDCETGAELRYGITAFADQLVEGEGAATYRRITITAESEAGDMTSQQVFPLPDVDTPQPRRK